ncbi:murein biosynthesis integral membrane protein MurJ [Butyrivibrio hungatei]|uniref:murein biosynthesis integral membrane protein MurJ n=1 Tax=Butyrivibrio hungatei TaxID=185008 RepID=UPI0003FBE783|nr:murein biosynthesis integral membrane protein MurJ [Butyrivibrio hungatei]
MKKTVLIFTIVSVFAKIIAFGRELVLSNYFGAGQVSDVFILSMTLPVTIFGFIATGVTSGYIPMYQKAKVEEGREVALKFTNTVINALIVICIAITAVYFIFPKQLLGIFASGFDDKTLELARQFTNFSIWATVFTAIVTVLSGYLQINDRIKITALVSVPLNLGVMITIIAAKIVGNIYILPIGFLLSSLIQVVFLWICSCKSGFKYSILLEGRDKYFKMFMSCLAVLILSGSLQQVNVLIDRTLATTVVVGGLSVYEYGNKISDFVMGLTIIPISAAVFPIMTKSKDDSKELCKILSDGIRLSSLIIIPASVIMVMFADVIVKILYYRGAFSLNDVIKTADVVKYYGVGLIAFSIREMIIKCFYAVGDTKSPMINSSIGVAINIVLNFILLRLLGLGGLALATSISAVICVVLLYRALKKYLKDIDIKIILGRCVVLYLVAGVVCYVALLIYKRVSGYIGGVIIPFVISMVCFSVAYFIISIATGMISVNEIKVLLKRK